MGMLTQHSFTTTFVLNRNGPVYTTFCPKVIDSQRAPIMGGALTGAVISVEWWAR